METVRKAMGFEKINLLSQSYGTRVAMIYAWEHPQSILHSAMLAVNPPGHFVWDPQVIDEQIEHYSKLWAKDPEMTARVSNLAGTMREIAHNMPQRWLIFKINPGKVKLISFLMLHNSSSAKLIFDAYALAKNGDFSGLAFMSLAYDLMIPYAMIWGDLFTKGYSDHVPLPDFLNPEVVEKTILGSPFSTLLTGAIGQDIWPAKSYPDKYRQVHPTDVQTLLMGGSVDFSTPARYATSEYLPVLTNGKQVIVSEFGHTGDLWNLQPEATRRLLTSFFDTGNADDSLFTYQPMKFKTGFLTFSSIAKILLGIVIIFFAGLAFSGWRIVRRIKKRRNIKK